jgi:hypothetical protein
VRLVQAIEAGNIRQGDFVMWLEEDSVGPRNVWCEVRTTSPHPDNMVSVGQADGHGFLVKRHAQVLVAR